MNARQSLGRGKAVLVADRAGVLKIVEAGLTPDFKIVVAGDSSEDARRRAVENVGFTHRRAGGTDFYFLSNISHFVQDLRAQFNVDRRVPQRWNPETNTIEETLAFDYVDLPQAKVTEVQIHLDPFESCFYVFGSSERPVIARTNCSGPLQTEKLANTKRVTGVATQNGAYFMIDARGKTHRVAVKDLPEPVSIGGPWRLTLGDQAAVALDRLQSWTDLPAGKRFSGWGSYETTFEVRELPSRVDWVIDLGTVHETAEVFLNGIELGAAWKGLRRLPCGNALKKGSNHLKVEVGNLWIQKVESLPNPDLKPVAETFGIRWGVYGELKPPSLPPSGLLGPVRLLPRKRIAFALENA